MTKSEPFKRNPFSALSEIKLVPVPDQILTHEPRVPLRSYLSRPDEPLRALAEALNGGRRPKTIEIEKQVPGPAEEQDDEPVQDSGSRAEPRWGR